MTPDDLLQLLGHIADMHRRLVSLSTENAELRRRLDLATGQAKQDDADLADLARGLAGIT